MYKTYSCQLSIHNLQLPFIIVEPFNIIKPSITIINLDLIHIMVTITIDSFVFNLDLLNIMAFIIIPSFTFPFV